MIEIQDSPGLYRSLSSKAVVVNNPVALQEAKERQKIAKTKRQEFNNISEKVASMENDIKYIKELLEKVIGGINGI